MRHSFILLALVVAGVPAADKADKQAKKVVQVDNQTKMVVGPFVAALRTKDSDAIMKVVDVPWFHSGKKVIRDRNELKKEVQEIVKNDFKMAGFHYKDLHRFGNVMGELTEQQRELAKGVIDKEDLVVTLQVFLPKGGEQIIHLVVRRKGEYKIIGVLD